MKRRGVVSGLAHVGIAVSDLEYMLGVLHQFGFELVRREEMPAQAATSNIVRAGSLPLELLDASDGAGNVGQFLAKRGPGLHHLCLNVSDIGAAMAVAEQAGLRLLDSKPSQDSDGLRVFVHPKSAGGVLIGLVQPYGEDERGR